MDDGKADRPRDAAQGDATPRDAALVDGRYAYMVDMYSELCTFDLEAKKVVHHQTLDLYGFTHYNALAVAASPTLIGGHIVILDNQGTALVLTRGPEPKVVHRNVIATQLERRIPLPSQEILAYAPPIVDGDRIYLRGERYLYCIAGATPRRWRTKFTIPRGRRQGRIVRQAVGEVLYRVTERRQIADNRLPRPSPHG